MNRVRAIAVLLLVLSGLAHPAHAQFYSLGADPGGLRWNSLDTPTYQLIYPRGLDSLARVYALALERSATPVGASLGFRPNEAYRKRMPVVLHAVSAQSNGQVTWTPRRMELLTTPDASSFDATPWVNLLAVHESRHVAQMQAGGAKPFRWLRVLGGELAAGGLCAVYGGPAFLEGDAVVAETALNPAGRGRTADFLEYFRVSFAAGDYRDYWRWRYGSQRYYTPDYYRAGYLAVGGIRAVFDVPDLTTRFYRRIADHGGVAFFNWNKTVREATGLRFRDAFSAVCDSLQRSWAADEAARGPFLPATPVSATPRRFTEYRSLTGAGDGFYAVRSGITRPSQLVWFDAGGREQTVGLLGVGLSHPRYSAPAGRLYWSEIVSDERWPLRSWSVVRSFDGTRQQTLTRKTRYYHPMPDPDAPRLAVTEYPVDGSSRVVLLDAEDGSELRHWTAPDGLQVSETVWVGGELYASALTQEGAGLYRVADFSPVLTPRPVTISQLWAAEGRLLFTCDLSGVNELYALDPQDGGVQRLTTTRFGASDFEIVRDTLFYASLLPEGRLVHATALADLRPEPADFSVLPRYPFAEELAAGEPLPVDWQAPVELGGPQPYSKLAHLFHVHSWLPVYFKYDSVDELSLASITQDAGLGATLFFQNALGTGWGQAGYHAAPTAEGWRHSAHATFTYTGLYPVIETGLDLGDRNAWEYRVKRGQEQISLEHIGRDIMSVSGYVRTYIPWNFSSGGWLRGLIPSAVLVMSNDRDESGASMHRTAFSLRGYLMQRTPASRVFPRFGFGAEAGWCRRWSSRLIAPAAYGFLYGYLPGLFETHGLRWTATVAHRFDNGTFSEILARTAPRGFDPDVSSRLAAYTNQFKGSLDYVMPLINVDRAILGPAAYLRNFELTLHGDWAGFRSPSQHGNLYSVGADLTAVLGNLFWIPYPTRIGVSCNYNGGSSYEAFAEQGLPMERFKLSMIFSVELQ